MTAIRAVLFDKDGTLFDYNKTWANWSRRFHLALAHGDVAHSRRLGDAVGFEFDFGAFRPESLLVSETPATIVEALLPHLPGASRMGLLTRMAHLSSSVPQAEATPLKPLMTELAARGLTLGVVTNDLLGPARGHLADAGILELFDGLMACDCGFAPKPAPDMLQAFADRVGHAPAEIVMVGDSRHDMVAAREAGMRRVAVLTGPADRSQLDPLAEAVLPSIAGLPGWLDREAEARSAA